MFLSMLYLGSLRSDRIVNAAHDDWGNYNIELGEEQVVAAIAAPQFLEARASVLSDTLW